MSIPQRTEVVIDNQLFFLCIDSNNSPIEDYWKWTAQDKTFPTGEQQARLKQCFMADYAPEIYASLTESQRSLFMRVLRSMKATDEQLYRIGALDLPEKDAALIDSNDQFGSTPPSGWSFTNCFELAKIFFDANPPKSLVYSFEIIGIEPFSFQQLYEFFAPYDDDMSGSPIRVHCVVLGRSNFKRSEIDACIEEHRGHFLRFYSQEMLLSVLAGLPDPFEEHIIPKRYKMLMAFKAGHPGLEYVDRGWRGWVDYGLRETSVALSQSSQDNALAIESPLHAMGYKVGNSGKPINERREILTKAFLFELPFVQSHQYMLAWGQGGTAMRLQRIANQIVSNIERYQYRGPRYSNALRDWHDDLEWLRVTFYQGSLNFSWPQALA